MIGRIRSKAQRAFNDIVFNTSFGATAINNKNGNIILMYHGIDSSGQNLFNGRHTPVSYFEKQVRFLKANYNLVSLSDFFKKANSTKNLCAITFDDGYLNNLTNALPVLEKYNAPATFFITGMNEIGCDILWADFVNIVNKLCTKEVSIGGEDFINNGKGYVSKATGTTLMEIVKNQKPAYSYKEEIYAVFNPLVNFRQQQQYKEYWQLMSDEELKKLSVSALVTIGSHGYYHNNLGNVSNQAAFDELVKSKKYLENIIQKEVTTLGYPDGSYNDEVSRYAAQTGMVYQVCTERFNKEADRSNPYLKNRAGIYNFDSAANQLLSALNYPL